MDIQNLEIEHNRLLSILKEEKSPRVVLFYLNKFLSNLISINDIAVYESYFIEHLSKYIDQLKSFKPAGVDPHFIEDVIQNAKTLLRFDIFKEYQGSLSIAINNLEKKNLIILQILDGRKVEGSTNIFDAISFPVIEQHSFDNKYFGLIEHITIILRKGSRKSEDSITVIPSQENLEKRLSNQIQISWKLAKEFCQKYIHKFYPRHEIIIRFSEKYGNYVGESLGVALTIGFIQELHKLYNFPTDVHVNNSAVFTGGIDEDGIVKSISSDIIVKKIETVFYSCKTNFAIPKNDEKEAREKLAELNKAYPERKLKLISVKDLDDVLDHRNLVSLQRQKFTKRFIKYAKSPPVSIFLGLILISLLTFYFIRQLDNNPVRFENEGYFLNVENQYGKVLWTKKMGFDSNNKDEHVLTIIDQKIFDINNDGVNEVLLCLENLKGTKEENQKGRIACFDNKGKLIWKYNFNDSISTNNEVCPIDYQINLLNVVKETDKKIIYAYSKNGFGFSSAVFRLDALTGKRLKGTLWHPGHFTGGIISDFNNDGEQEIVLEAINNGLERSAVMSINIENINGAAPSTNKYEYKGYPIAKFNHYILLPKTDYTEFYNDRFNAPKLGSLTFNYQNNKFLIGVLEAPTTNVSAGIYYSLDTNLSHPKILIGDDFHMMRDALVKSGKLNPPLTNTKEYENILLNQFEEWNAKTGKFEKMMKR